MGTGISAGDLESMIGAGERTIILDMRPAEDYVAGHVEGAANARCGSMQQKQVIMAKMPRGSKVVLIDADGSAAAQNAEMMTQFGFDAHHLEGGMAGWGGKTVSGTHSPLISGGELWGSLGEKDVFLLDVREPEEFAAHRIEGAVNVPLARLFEKGACDSIPKGKKVVTICSHGNRSMIATFALASNGIESTSLDGGMAGWSQVLVPKKVAETEGNVVIQVEKVGKGCLSYIVVNSGKAAVIDAVHPVRAYEEIAASEGFEIVTVADTHCHADHISGARELAMATGAKLYLSSTEKYDIECARVAEGDIIPFGGARLRAIHVPGHTPGSMAYMVGKVAFCGDTVFADGIGRPDLHEEADAAAAELYRTIHECVGALGDETMILPAHRSEATEPSAEGSYGISVAGLKASEAYGTASDEFVGKVTQGIPPKPPNYSMIIKFNRGSMPLNPAMIPDLEAGPNRCAVRA